MPKTTLRKEKWTLSFDPTLKGLAVRAAQRRGVYPVTLLEDLVREKFNPFGHTDIAVNLLIFAIASRMSSM